uniref:Rho-GAP domain-containing protein n=1 Tax=Panagrolaimus sp. PS1159 TaxID=55785 RepID=A0AC35GAJ1_9BILA
MHAIKENDEQQIITCVFELPPPHRDTLAYFILHLQKVSQHSSSNKMPIENLARVLAPTIIGYSKRLPYKMAEEFTVNYNQTMILHRLLKLPSEFWRQFLEKNVSQFAAVEGRSSNYRTSPPFTSSSALSARQPHTYRTSFSPPPPPMPRS